MARKAAAKTTAPEHWPAQSEQATSRLHAECAGQWLDRIKVAEARNAEVYALRAADPFEERDAEIADLRKQVDELEADEATEAAKKREAVTEIRDQIHTLRVVVIAQALDDLRYLSKWIKGLPPDVALPGFDSDWCHRLPRLFEELTEACHTLESIVDTYGDGDDVHLTCVDYPNKCVGPGDIDYVTRCVIEADDARVIAGERKQ